MDIRNKRQHGTRLLVFFSAISMLTYSTNTLAKSFSGIDKAASLNLTARQLTNEELDYQRGGFIDVEGFKVNIGLEKVVLIDGDVVAQSSLVIPNIKESVNQKVGQAMGKLNARMEKLDKDMAQLKNSLDMVEDSLSDTQNSVGAGLTDAQADAVAVISPAIAFGAKNVAKPLAGSSSATKVHNNTRSTAIVPASSQLPQANIPVNDMKATVLSMNDTTTVIQNSVDNRVIQSLQVINMELSNIARRKNSGIRSRLLPQLIHSAR